MPRHVHPGRLRRRLTLAFMLTAGLSAAILAAGSYLVVRENRLDDAVERSLDQGRFNLVLAGEIAARARSEPRRTEAILLAFERRGEFATVAESGRRTFSSSLSLRAAQVPADLERLVERDQLAYERTRLAGTRYLVVGGRVAGTPVELYFFFSEEELWDELGQLRRILLAGSALLVLLAGLAGALVARRALAPVARASAAARSLAEGLLATRLPVERADEFGAWATSFNEMADALEAKIAREQRFTADVAHELRTPLTALVAEASLLAEHLERLPPEARRPAELLVEDVARLRRLVEDLLEISRLDAGREAVRRARLELRALVAGALTARGWDDEVRLDGEDVVLETDRRRLERIVANLVENALEHGGEDVRVRVDRDGARAVVEVVDDGPGIGPEHLPHLFERFYKADAARATPGSGLGLAIAREHARLLGGEIAARSEPGRGTTFTLTLPVTEPLQSGDGRVARAGQDAARGRQGGEK